MRTIRTHYDELQIAENASPEVIRGAYRYLAQKWHPDKNPTDRERAERFTSKINEAYSVLSDPERRHAHDRCVASQRAAASDARQASETANTSTASPKATVPDYLAFSTPRVGVLKRTWLMLLFVTSLAFLLIAFPYQIWSGDFKWSYLAGVAFWAAAAHYAYTKLFQKIE